MFWSPRGSRYSRSKPCSNLIGRLFFLRAYKRNAFPPSFVGDDPPGVLIPEGLGLKRSSLIYIATRSGRPWTGDSLVDGVCLNLDALFSLLWLVVLDSRSKIRIQVSTTLPQLQSGRLSLFYDWILNLRGGWVAWLYILFAIQFLFPLKRFVIA